MRIQKRIYIMLLLFTLLFISGCGQSGSRNNKIIMKRVGSGGAVAAAKESVEATEEPSEEVKKEGLYLITKIDTGQALLEFIQMESGKNTEYAYTIGTKFLNKYGTSTALSSFQPGDVVEVDVSGHTKNLSVVQLSDKTWINDDVYNFSIEQEIGAFTIGKTKYAFGEDLLVFSKDTAVSLDSIGANDTLKAVGIGKKLISLSIQKGHGSLRLSNTELFDGSFICVGDKIFKEVKPDMEIEVPEGKQTVTVANNGYGGSKEIEIVRGESTALDLNELKGEGPKVCKVTFEINVAGAVLTVDGAPIDYTVPTEIQYGVHTISVSADGYDPVSQKLVVNSEDATIQIGLEQQGSEEDTDSSSDSNANNNNTNNSNTNNNNNNNTNNSNNNNNNNSNNNNNNNSNTNNNNNSNNNNNTSNNNTNNSNNTNNNNSNYNNSNNNNSSTTDTSTTDYLTTLYNLLNSINSDDIKDE